MLILIPLPRHCCSDVQENLMLLLRVVLRATYVPPNILQTLLNLAEFMEHEVGEGDRDDGVWDELRGFVMSFAVLNRGRHCQSIFGCWQIWRRGVMIMPRPSTTRYEYVVIMMPSLSGHVLLFQSP